MKKKTTGKNVDADNADRKKAQKPIHQKPQPALPSREIVTLAASLVAVSKLLIVCAPKFPDGSEGSQTVELARRSIPLALNIIRTDKKEGAHQ